MRTDRNVVVPSRGIRVLALIAAIAATLAVEVNPANGQDEQHQAGGDRSRCHTPPRSTSR